MGVRILTDEADGMYGHKRQFAAVPFAIHLSMRTSQLALCGCSEPLHLAAMTEEEYASHRYAIGIPEGPLEITPNEAFPLESNFDYLNGGMLFR